MRDFERLEELSSTVQSGLRYNEVIWAIDQALAGRDLDEESKASLVCAHQILEDWRNTGAMTDPGETRRSQSMLGGEGRTGESVVVFTSQLGDEEDGEKAAELLTKLSRALEAMAAGEDPSEHRESLEMAAEVFSRISEIKLGQANGLVRARGERTSWLPRTTISTFS